MCNYLLHMFFLEYVKTWVGRTTLRQGIALGDKKKNYATPTNEDLGKTTDWSKIVEETELRKADRTVAVNCNIFSNISSGTA